MRADRVSARYSAATSAAHRSALRVSRGARGERPAAAGRPSCCPSASSPTIDATSINNSAIFDHAWS